MNGVRLNGPPPALRRPVLVAAFEGWNDAGESASGAVEALAALTSAQPFADVDPEDFFDFQLTRPEVRIADGGSRALDWPTNQFSWSALPDHRHDLVLLAGTEPNLRWRTFSKSVVETMRQLDVELIVTLGALQIDLPHTRPTPLTGSASDGELASRIGLPRSSYEGPTGITGVLHHACDAAGMPSVSLWAGVPHYLAGSRFAAGSLALTEAVGGLLGIELPLDALAREAVTQRDEIAELLGEDEDLAEYVADLERRADAQGPAFPPVLDDGGDLPAATVSGDELAAEFERYLRNRRREG